MNVLYLFQYVRYEDVLCSDTRLIQSFAHCDSFSTDSQSLQGPDIDDHG